MVKLIKNPRITHKDNFVWLLASLLLLLFASSLFDQLGIEWLQSLMGILVTAIVLIAVWSLEGKRVKFLPPRVVYLLLIAIFFAEAIVGHYLLGILQLATLLFFIVMSIVIASRQVLFSGPVDGNKIIGAICIYMLMAIAWALAYLLVENFFPGSIPGIEHTDWRGSLSTAVYFSFVSLSTVGFGDISPTQPLARYLCYIEVVAGQFYLAILVASLIGVRMSNTEREQ